MATVSYSDDSVLSVSSETYMYKLTSYDERFEHPARTWASSSHRKFTHAAVGIAMAAATFRFMQATAKTAMRRVLGIRGGPGETLVPPTAVAGGDEGFVFEFEASDNNNSG
jgi:hypothetical protein